MSRATFKIDTLPNGDRRIAIACSHGTAYGGSLHTGPLPEPAAVAAIVLRHRQGWGCRCARKLARQFPPELIPRELRVVELLL